MKRVACPRRAALAAPATTMYLDQDSQVSGDLLLSLAALSIPRHVFEILDWSRQPHIRLQPTAAGTMRSRRG
jgi:hypothetical protein